MLSGNQGSVLVCLGATSCAVIAGYSISFTSVAMDDLQRSVDQVLHLTAEQATWFGSILPLMAIFGSLSSGPIMDGFGRKIALLFTTMIFLISWIFLCQSYVVSCLFIGRGLSGLATGMSTAILPMYISEVSPSHLRGTMGGVFSVFLALGLPIGYGCGIWLDWRLVAEIGAAISCISFLIIFLLPESHYWLVKQGKEFEAIKTMKLLRGSSYDFCRELDEIRLLQKEVNGNNAACSEIVSIRFLKPLGIGVALMVFQQCSGVNAIFFYAHEIFRRANFDNEAVASVLASSMQVLSIAFATLLVENVGRRRLLMCSALGMMVCHLFIGGCMFYITNGTEVTEDQDIVGDFEGNSFVTDFYRSNRSVNDTEYHGEVAISKESAPNAFIVSWACLLFVMLYIAMYSIGLGPVPYIVLSEMVPFRGRGVACGIGTMCNWLCAFLLTKSFIGLIDLFEVYGVFWIFSVICLLATLFIWRFVFETSGKTLTEIQDILANGSRHRVVSTEMKKHSAFNKLLRHPVSPKACTRSTRSTSIEEQSQDLIESFANA